MSPQRYPRKAWLAGLTGIDADDRRLPARRLLAEVSAYVHPPQEPVVSSVMSSIAVRYCGILSAVIACPPPGPLLTKV